MLIEDGQVIWGKWLPDLPTYENPGLVEAKNCLPVDTSYKAFPSAVVSDDALAAAPRGAFATFDDAGDAEIYAGTETTLVEKVGASWTDRTPAGPYALGANDYWRFTQFDSYVIATNFADLPQKKTIGASADFEDLADTGTAPRGRQVGVINRFVLLGDIDDGTAYPHGVQWPAINDPTNWQTPNTAAARAVQAGRQLLDLGHGAVTAIASGQFSGLIFQKRAITRATYVGGDGVFQFETFEKERGCWAPQSMFQLGGLCFFLAHDGWCMTDGQSVSPIGSGEVDSWFYARLDTTRLKDITVAVDWQSRCILWNFPSSSAPDGYTDHILAFNTQSPRWAWGEETLQMLLQSYTQGYTLEQLDNLFSSIDDMQVSLDDPQWQGGNPTLMLFDDDTLGTLTGPALTATFETAENAPNAFGYTFIRGARPMVTGNPTSITMRIGTRDNLDGAGIVYGSAVQRTTRSGVCDFRVQGKYISAQMVIAGGFNRSIGFGVDAEMGDGV